MVAVILGADNGFFYACQVMHFSRPFFVFLIYHKHGWSKLDLIPEGVEQAKLLAKHIKENNDKYKIGRIISSDLPRTMTTAKFISAELGIAIQEEPQIRETNNGDLAGILNDVALVQYPGLFFSSLRMDEAYPNGESPHDFYLRIKQWFWTFCSECQNADDNILIVTHSGVINVVYHLVADIEWSNKSHLFKAANCSVHILDVDAMEFIVKNRTDFLMV